MYSRREFVEKLVLSTGGVLVLLKTDALAKAAEAARKIQPDKSPKEVSSDESFWSVIQNSFEVDRTIINLNNGGVSPAPKTVMNELKKYLDYSNQAPSLYMWRDLEPNIETVRQKLADTFGCSSEEIAVTRNASESLEIVQQGIDLKPGDEILTTDQDYPRMLTTFNKIERRYGIKVNRISFPVPLINKNDFIEAIKNGITPNTKLLLVSHVVFRTGQILPILEISRLAHQKGIKLICDGAHSFNHFPFTLKDLECDYFGSSLHKWTYAPVGTGMLYVKKELIKDTWPLMAAPIEMDNNIRKFEEIGTHPAANHNAIAEALAFNEIIGVERKAERLRYLNLRWINRLKKYDNVKFMVNVENQSNWCGIVTVNIEGVSLPKLVSYLYDKHRIFVVRITHEQFNGIRVSPNVYTMLSEIDKFAEVMEDAATGKIKEILET